MFIISKTNSPFKMSSWFSGCTLYQNAEVVGSSTSKVKKLLFFLFIHYRLIHFWKSLNCYSLEETQMWHVPSRRETLFLQESDLLCDDFHRLCSHFIMTWNIENVCRDVASKTLVCSGKEKLLVRQKLLSPYITEVKTKIIIINKLPIAMVPSKHFRSSKQSEIISADIDFISKKCLSSRVSVAVLEYM